jgi:hypothetical protein
MADEKPQNENDEQREEQDGGSSPISRDTAGTLAKGAAIGAAGGAAIGAAAAGARKARSRDDGSSQDAETDDVED